MQVIGLEAANGSTKIVSKGGDAMGFVFGVFVGGILGVSLMAILSIGKASDERMMKLQEEAETHEELH